MHAVGDGNRPVLKSHCISHLQKQEVEFSVRVSYLELYNEELFDLLGSGEDPLRLRIYEDNTRKVMYLLSSILDYHSAHGYRDQHICATCQLILKIC